MRAYSLDLRERVCADYQAGLPMAAVGQKYLVSALWVCRLKHGHKATGSLAAPALPRPTGRDGPARRARTRTGPRPPDATLAELRQRLGHSISLSNLSAYLRRIEFSFK